MKFKWLCLMVLSSLLSVTNLIGETTNANGIILFENTDFFESFWINTNFVTVFTAIDLKEDDLGTPAADDYVLSSDTNNTRSWIAQGTLSQTPYVATHDAAGFAITNLPSPTVSSGAATKGYVDAADTVASNGVTAAFIAADTVVSNALQAQITPNTTHRTSDGSDHTFIDQSVISGSSPVFNLESMTNIAAVATNTPSADDVLKFTTGDSYRWEAESGGGGSGSQTPWTNTVDAAGNDITDGGDATFTNFHAASGATLNNPPSFKAIKTGAQAISATTPTLVTWQTELWDIGGGLDLANDKYVPPFNGKYIISYTTWASTGVPTAGYSHNMIYTNGALAYGIRRNGYSSDPAGMVVSTTLNLTTNDEVTAYTTFSTAESVGPNGSTSSTVFEGRYVGE